MTEANKHEKIEANLLPETPVPDDLDEITRTVAPDAPRMGFVQRFVSLFVAPYRLMRNIRKHPVVLPPLVVALLIALASTPLTVQYTEIAAQEISRLMLDRGVPPELLNLGPAVVDEYGDITEAAAGSFPDAIVLVNALAGTLLVAFLGALWLLIITKIARGRASLGQYFSMYMHIAVVSALAAALMMALSIYADTPLDITSAAAIFMPAGNVTMLGFNLLSVVSLANLWGTALVCLGVKAINGFSTVKAALLALLSFAATAAVHVVLNMAMFWIF